MTAPVAVFQSGDRNEASRVFALSFGTVTIAALSQRARAQGSLKEIRIGYQKNGVLVIVRQRATLEEHFGAQGVDVKFVEFSSGPPMMEAMNVGSIDYGAV